MNHTIKIPQLDFNPDDKLQIEKCIKEIRDSYLDIYRDRQRVLELLIGDLFEHCDVEITDSLIEKMEKYFRNWKLEHVYLLFDMPQLFDILSSGSPDEIT